MALTRTSPADSASGMLVRKGSPAERKSGIAHSQASPAYRKTPVADRITGVALTRASLAESASSIADRKTPVADRASGFAIRKASLADRPSRINRGKSAVADTTGWPASPLETPSETVKVGGVCDDLPRGLLQVVQRMGARVVQILRLARHVPLKAEVVPGR